MPEGEETVLGVVPHGGRIAEGQPVEFGRQKRIAAAGSHSARVTLGRSPCGVLTLSAPSSPPSWAPQFAPRALSTHRLLRSPLWRMGVGAGLYRMRPMVVGTADCCSRDAWAAA